MCSKSCLHVCRRYRQVVKGDPAEYTTKWVDDPNFNVKNHIFEHHLPAPGNKEQLQDLISDLFTGALDRSKPLWDSHLIQGMCVSYGMGEFALI